MQRAEARVYEEPFTVRDEGVGAHESGLRDVVPIRQEDEGQRSVERNPQPSKKLTKKL